MMSGDDQSVFGTGPAPSPDDVLFRAADDWQANACIAKWDADWAYSSGFRRGAFQLAQHVCNTASDQDVLVYPIVYLYRHHVELVLKSIIRSASGLLDRELSEQDEKALGRHSLSELWQITRPLLDPVCQKGGDQPFPPSELDGIDSYIRQIHEHDPDGQRFRYATTKVRRAGQLNARAPSLSPDLTQVNVRVLANAMERLADYLENVEGWFGDLEDAKREYEAQYDR